MNVDNTVQLVSCSVQWQCQRSCQAGWLHSWCTAGEMRHVWPWQSTWLSHRYTADSSWQHRPWLPSTQLTASPTVQSHVTSYSMQRTASANRRRQVSLWPVSIALCVRFGVSHTCIRCVFQITFLRCLSLFLQLRTVFTVESVGYGL